MHNRIQSGLGLLLVPLSVFGIRKVVAGKLITVPIFVISMLV